MSESGAFPVRLSGSKARKLQPEQICRCALGQEAREIEMPQSPQKNAKADVLRALAIDELQLLLGAEPHLSAAFRTLAERAQAPELHTLCNEGVTYTNRRVARIKKALGMLKAPIKPRRSTGLTGLISDAKRAGGRKKSPATDAALLAAIERISHFGLAIYTSIDRYLRGADAPAARRVLIPSTKEKREAIGEMSRMARRKLLPRV